MSAVVLSVGAARIDAPAAGPGIPLCGYSCKFEGDDDGRSFCGRSLGSPTVLGASVLVPKGVQFALFVVDDVVGEGRAVSFALTRLISSPSYSAFNSLASAGVMRSHEPSPGSFSSNMRE